ncbi:MAG: phosphatase PAP2 family protein [Acholeplasma sp.]|jgi:undecaprenyl-diphosphatase|nr:MAG: phosphatase PAP2 family protein [Acholeplasma sp.]
MELEIIYRLQDLRNAFLDGTFYLITQLGDQIFFILVAGVLYWTVDKRLAHKFVFAFMMSAIANTALKNVFKRTRPFYYPGVESEPSWRTTGYSFPSGHAQASGVLGYTAYHISNRYKKPIYKSLGLFIMIMVPLSRMYLGQHFLTDVIAGLFLALGVTFLSFKLVEKMGDDEHIYTLMLTPFFIAALLFFPNHDLAVGAGGFAGFAIGYYFEKKYIQYVVSAKIWIQVLKVLLGLAIALVIKEGLKFIFPDRIFFDFLRYLLIGGWAALGAPLTFKYVFKHRQENI